MTEKAVREDLNVIIIGAGAAGLYAGLSLRKLGISFQILEASDVYGGRLAPLYDFADFQIDLGAQWLHGKNSLLGDIIKQHSIPIKADDSREYFWFRNAITKKPPFNFDIFEDDDLPDLSYTDFARKQGLNADYDGIIEYLAGDLGASASQLSVYHNNREFEEWTSGETNYKFEDTFFDVIDKHVASTIKDAITLNTAALRFDYSKDDVIITDDSGRTHRADKVIITSPVTVLRSGDMEFIPKLPAEKISVFSKLGMEAAIKIYLRFSERFYHETTLGGKVCAAYIDERYGKKGDDNVLLAYLMGEQAEKLMALGNDNKMTQAILKELDRMYDGKASRHFEAARIKNWTAHPWIRGGYSYSTCGMGNARQVAAKPVSGKLYFAGEAMNTKGHHQSVHGAMESGLRAVVEIVGEVQG
ncbi:MAG: FAD-dependent oxidoreductase [Balneolia bacterium]|nr:FAD-dependent oxidoreductase [Balneolia bacterium]